MDFGYGLGDFPSSSYHLAGYNVPKNVAHALGVVLVILVIVGLYYAFKGNGENAIGAYPANAKAAHAQMPPPPPVVSSPAASSPGVGGVYGRLQAAALKNPSTHIAQLKTHNGVVALKAAAAHQGARTPVTAAGGAVKVLGAHDSGATLQLDGSQHTGGPYARMRAYAGNLGHGTLDTTDVNKAQYMQAAWLTAQRDAWGQNAPYHGAPTLGGSDKPFGHGSQFNKFQHFPTASAGHPFQVGSPNPDTMGSLAAGNAVIAKKAAAERGHVTPHPVLGVHGHIVNKKN